MNANDKRTLATISEPTLVPVQRAVVDGEPEVPSHVRQRAYEEVSSEAAWEWTPVLPFEALEGTLVRKTGMRLGGTAYVFDTRNEDEMNQKESAPRLVLLKKGGKILDSCMATVVLGERVWIRFLGELPAKPGLNAARDWRVIRLQ